MKTGMAKTNTEKVDHVVLQKTSPLSHFFSWVPWSDFLYGRVGRSLVRWFSTHTVHGKCIRADRRVDGGCSRTSR